MLSESHIFILVLLVAVIFGASKLPEIGSGLGKGIKNFKSSIKELKENKKEIQHNNKDEE